MRPDDTRMGDSLSCADTPASSPAPNHLSAWCHFEGNKAAGFGVPRRVLCASQLSEIPALLHAVEDEVSAGAHAIGYVAYEAAPAFDPAMHVREREIGDVPLVWFAVYEPGQVAELGWPEAASIRRSVRGSSVQASHGSNSRSSSSSSSSACWRSTCGRASYAANVESVRAHIREGRAYQVNFTMRLHAAQGGLESEQAPYEGGGDAPLQFPLPQPCEPEALLTSLLQAQRCGFGAFLDIGTHSVLSASPELFFRWSQRTGHLETRPMKGTAKRGLSSAADDAARAALASSEKDRAENLMIVDLLRNDLGRICVPGSVAVPALFAVEAYPTVLQLTSTVAGRTRPGMGLGDILSALFPCGSITGAPKVSSMRIISELESEARGVYCGSILYLRPRAVEAAETAGCGLLDRHAAGSGSGGEGASGEASCVQHGASTCCYLEPPSQRRFTLEATASVCIRTTVVNQRTGALVYGVGGGVTWDSTGEGEYEEAVDKTAVLRLASRACMAAGSEGMGGRGGAANGPAVAVPRSQGDNENEEEDDWSLVETLLLRLRGTGGNEAPTPHSAGFEYALLEGHARRLAASSRYFGLRLPAAASRAVHAAPPPLRVANGRDSVGASAAATGACCPPPLALHTSPGNDAAAAGAIVAFLNAYAASLCAVAASAAAAAAAELKNTPAPPCGAPIYHRVRLLLRACDGSLSASSVPCGAPCWTPGEEPTQPPSADGALTCELGGPNACAAALQQPGCTAVRAATETTTGAMITSNALLALHPVPRESVHLYHKSSRRGVYDAARWDLLGALEGHPPVPVPTDAESEAGVCDLWVESVFLDPRGPRQCHEGADFVVDTKHLSPPPARQGLGAAATALRASPPQQQILLWNSGGELTEFTIGNVVLELPDDDGRECDIDGARWARFTPPVSCGLLPGVAREALLGAGALRERVCTLADLGRARRVWMINSVRGWVQIGKVGRVSLLV